jgi:hypothetical protein
MNLKFWKRRTRNTESAPRKLKKREGARTYVAGHGYWGNRIGYDLRPTCVSVHGFLSSAPFPQEGDVLLIPTTKEGIYGAALMYGVSRCHDPNDMFTAYAETEPFEMVEVGDKVTRPDHFIPSEDMSMFLRC